MTCSTPCAAIHPPKGWTVERVLEWFAEQRGQAFDPDLVDVLLECMPEMIDVRHRLRD